MIVKTLIKNLEYGQLELGCGKTFLMAYNIFIGTAWTSLKEHAVNKLSMILPKNMGNLS
jgi:hypothetical protein